MKKKRVVKKSVKRVIKKSGIKVKNAVKSVYDGISFDSLLELFTYKTLKSNGITNFGRENWTVDLIESFKFNGVSYHSGKTKSGQHVMKMATPKIKAMTYTPDFVSIDHKSKTGWVIECKGWKTELSPIKRKLFKQFLTKHGYNVHYFEPNNQINVLKCVEIIKGL